MKNKHPNSLPAALLIASVTSFVIPASCFAHNEIEIITHENSQNAGISYENVLSAFRLAGFDSPVDGVFVLRADDENSEVELKSLQGHIVRVSADDIILGIHDSPRNIRF